MMKDYINWITKAWVAMKSSLGHIVIASECVGIEVMNVTIEY